MATLDFLAFQARRRSPARLLIIGTYRPVDVILRQHPLKGMKHELHVHKLCCELALPLLGENAVGEYVARRFGKNAFRAAASRPQKRRAEHRPLVDLARALHRATEGNPLFVENLVDYLLTRGTIHESHGSWRLGAPIPEIAKTVPDDLRELIEKHVEQLSADEQRVLGAASIAGDPFLALPVAEALGDEPASVDDLCARLAARRLFLRREGPHRFPDGTETTCYAFLHTLHQKVLYDRLPASVRRRLHGAIADSEERLLGPLAHQSAAKLALHFSEAGDVQKTVRYLRFAGEGALRRFSNREAMEYFREALDRLEALPDAPEKQELELRLVIGLGVPLLAVQGFGTPEAVRVYKRAESLRASKHLFVEARYALGYALVYRGDVVDGTAELERGVEAYDPSTQESHAPLYGFDPGVACGTHVAWSLWMQGSVDRALERAVWALSLARKTTAPFDLAMALNFLAVTHLFRGEVAAAEKASNEVMALSVERGFYYWRHAALMSRGAALAFAGRREEGIAALRRGIEACDAVDIRAGQSCWLGFLVEALRLNGDRDAARDYLAKALELVESRGERWWEPDLHRLRGELADEADGEPGFQRALELARLRGSISLELRAAVAMARRWRERGRKSAARELVSEVYGRFTEGFQTADLVEASSLLRSLW
jgi:adenylate cyclase